MYNDKKILAIIPARGGSKGIPHKNIMSICDKPLIYYTIKAGTKSKFIDKVIVSTDDAEIKNVSEAFGARVPFLRPDELSADNAKSIDVVIHAINFFINSGERFDAAVLLQPTSPMRDNNDIDEALISFFEKKADSLVSVCEADENPVLMRKIEKDKLVEVLNYENDNLMRQKLPKFYIFNGAIYINTIEMILEKKRFIDENTVPFIMEKEKSIDIDEKLDAKIVEIIMKEKLYDK